MAPALPVPGACTGGSRLWFPEQSADHSLEKRATLWSESRAGAGAWAPAGARRVNSQMRAGEVSKTPGLVS